MTKTCFAAVLQVIGSLVRVFGRLDFVNNSNSKSLDGGSLYFTTMGQMELQDGSSLLLKDNSGMYVCCVCRV